MATVDKYMKASMHVVLGFIHSFQSHSERIKVIFLSEKLSQQKHYHERAAALNRHISLRSPRELDILILNYDLSTKEAETGSQPVRGHPGLYSETLSKARQTQKKALAAKTYFNQNRKSQETFTNSTQGAVL